VKELRAGIVGMGKMGLLHASILNSLDGVKLSAIADTEKLVSGFLKKQLHLVNVYEDYKDMIEKENLDLVYITTPVNSHIPIASLCAQKKIHFFIEKPLAKNTSECVSLIDIVKKNNTKSMVGFCLRYVETFAKAKELLDKDTIGKIVNIKSTVYQSQTVKKGTGWRFQKSLSGGGVLMDLGSHLIDLLLWYFGDIETVEGKTELHQSDELENSVNVTINFKNSLSCMLEASRIVQNYRLQETTIEAQGEYGDLKVNEDYVKLSFNSLGNQRGMQNEIFYRQSLSKGMVIDIAGTEYTKEDLEFILSITEDVESPLSVINSSKTQSVIDSIYLSAKNNSVEKVSYIA
jgi:predicted dehydrogenase